MKRADFYNVWTLDPCCRGEIRAYLDLCLEDTEQVRHAFDGYLLSRLRWIKFNLDWHEKAKARGEEEPRCVIGGAEPPVTWRSIWAGQLLRWGQENPQSFRRAWRAYRYDLKKRLEVDDWDFSHQSDAEIGLRYFRALMKLLAEGELPVRAVGDHWQKDDDWYAPSFSTGIRSEMEDLERYYPKVSYPWPPVLPSVERMAKIVENKFLPKLRFFRTVK